MSKKLEAFSRVWEDCSKLDLDYVSKHNLMDDLREIKQALTPPTEEEVCEALSEYFGKKVFVDKRYKISAFVVERGSSVAYINARNRLCLTQLPPHLVTLIGRFYEGVQHD